MGDMKKFLSLTWLWSTFFRSLLETDVSRERRTLSRVVIL